MQKVRDFGALSTKLDVFTTTTILTSRLMSLCKIVERNIWRAQGGGQLQENIVLETNWVDELKETVRVHNTFTRSRQTTGGEGDLGMPTQEVTRRWKIIPLQ